MRNRIFTFVLSNGFIESDIQKGFWTGLSGTIEHTELLTHIIKKAKLKQRSLVVTLFDLRNAFGEVHHNLIRKVLDYHHILPEVRDLVTSLYTDYYISVLTKDYHTNPNDQFNLIRTFELTTKSFPLCYLVKRSNT